MWYNLSSIFVEVLVDAVVYVTGAERYQEPIYGNNWLRCLLGIAIDLSVVGLIAMGIYEFYLWFIKIYPPGSWGALG